jgi:hypothetical protein
MEVMSEISDKIESKNHWWIDVRPTRYQAGRVEHHLLESVLQALVVRMRGWPVPFIDDRLAVDHGDKWIGQDIDASTVDHYEAWRFFETAQFSQLRAVSASWRTGTEATSVPSGFDAAIEVWEILYYLTEVTLLAARLASDLLQSDDEVTIAAHLRIVESNTALVGGYRNRAPLRPYSAPANLLPRVITLTTEKLVGEPAAPAVELASQIFNRFGWNPTPQHLQILQRELYQN